MARDLDGGDLIRIVNPTGILTDAAWSWLAKVRLISGAIDGRALMKVGPDNDTSNARGVYSHFRGTGSSNAINVIYGAIAATGDTALTTGTWYSIGITCSASGGGNIQISIDGVSDISQNTDPITEITTGDAYAIGYGFTTNGVAVADLEIAMQAWVQGVTITAANTDVFADDPCSLITSYGPSGSITANALKLLMLDDQTVDISGVGQTISLTGGASVAGPGGYPTTCAAPTNPLVDLAHTNQHMVQMAL